MRKSICFLLLLVMQWQLNAQVIISQYYEGTGTNKWIELTNMGVSAVNTASPQLKLGIWSVGGSTGNIAFTGAATASVNLSVTIPAKGSVLIGNTGNGTEISYLTAAAAAQTSNTVINFNGNDGIALLSATDVVLDRFGTGINATDISYVRNTSVTAPTATFSTAQWTTASIATVAAAATTSANRLGFHVPSIPLCTTPGAPTTLTLTPTTNSINGSFTATAGITSYMVVRSTSASLASNPVNGTVYAAGNTVGGGTVVNYGTATTFNATGLTASTTYYFYVFSARTSCTGEPFYSSALTGNSTTTASGGGGTYYDAAAGLTCQSLKTALKTITGNGFATLSYTPGIWNIYYYSDKRRNDANTADVVWDMYSDNPAGADPYTYTLGTNQCGTYAVEGNCYNREHSTPQSWFNSASPMVSDAHHIFATDGKVNGIRSNYPYGEVSNASTTTLNGSKLGTGTTNFGYTGIVFEPINAYKGDFARACLYMATRYEDQIIAQNWSGFGNGNDVFLSAANQPDAAKRRLFIYDPWFLQLLIKWHNQDPVSQKEIDRNNIIYTQQVVNNGSGGLVKQGNRNPFIDHPEYVAAIWGNGATSPCLAAIGAGNQSTDIDAVENNFFIYPNPAKNNISISVNYTVKRIEVADLYGNRIVIKAGTNTTGNVQVDIRKLHAGNYMLKLISTNGVLYKQFTKL
jgi:endonuclease I